VTSGSSGSGKGSAQYNVAPTANATDFRTGSLSVGLQTLIVAQGTASSTGPLFTSKGVVNAANYQGGGVAPGELITIFGKNLRPATLEQPSVSPSGVVKTAAGGTRVLFDGVAAPMIYTISGQVSAVAPFAIQGRAATQVQVEYLGEQSAPAAVPVVNALPGLFTSDASGTGTGAILNQDLSVNSAANPAEAGSIIVLYATGGGVVAPAVPDGSTLFTPLSRLTQSVSARVGGMDAAVLYAGVAPGIVAGVLQIDITIPEGVGAGSAVTVDLTIGGVTSQAGVTVAVR